MTLLILGQPQWAAAGITTHLRPREAVLLAYLNEQAPRAVPRDRLAQLLWPGASRPLALHSLSQLVHSARKKAAGAVWTISPTTVGLMRVPTDLDQLIATVNQRDSLNFFEVCKGQYLGAVGEFEGELGLWLTTRRQELIRLVEVGVRNLACDANLFSDVGDISREINRLLDDGITSPVLYAAVGALSLSVGDKSNYERVKRLLDAEYPDSDELARFTTALTSQAASAPSPSEREVRFVGRAAELANLDNMLRSVESGRGRTVLISGEAGIGKTRLATQVLKMAALRGFRIWTAKAHYATRHSSRATAVDLVQSSMIPGENSLRAGGPIARLQSSISRRLTAEAMQYDYLVLDDVVRETIQLSRHIPLAILIDDVQWVDESTAQLVSALASRLEHAAIALLLNLRTLEPDPTPAWIHELPVAAHLPLQPLEVTDAAELVSAYENRRGISIPPSLRNQVIRHGAGRPFLLLETLASQADSIEPDQFETGANSTSAGLLARRFRNLPHEAVWLYGIVAAARNPVRLADLELLAGLPSFEVAKQLEALTSRQILTIEGDRVWFPHDLLRDVAYELLAAPTRLIIHRRFATLAGELNLEEGLLAQHWASAGDGEGAARVALGVAQKLAEQGRYAETEFLLQMALASGSRLQREQAALILTRHYLIVRKFSELKTLAVHLPVDEQYRLYHEIIDFGDRLHRGDGSAEDMVAAALAIGKLGTVDAAPEALTIISMLVDIALDVTGYSGATEIIRKGIQRAEQRGARPIAKYLMYTERLWSAVTEGYSSALKQIATEEDSAGAHDPHFVRAMKYFSDGTVFLIAGQLSAARACLTKGLELQQAAGDAFRKPGTQANLGIALTELGEYAQARDHIEQCTNSPLITDRLRSLSNLINNLYESGDAEGATAAAQRLLRANAQYGARKYTIVANSYLGLLALDSNRLDIARTHMEEVWQHQDWKPPVDGDIPYNVAFVSRTLAALGDSSQALALCDQHERLLTGVDAIGVLRIRAARAQVLADSSSERAYGVAKAVLAECETIGAETIARRVRSIMERTRA